MEFGKRAVFDPWKQDSFVKKIDINDAVVQRSIFFQEESKSL